MPAVSSCGELSLTGSSASIRKLRMQIERIAPHFRSVLIRGERGTGKELVARILHAKRGMTCDTFLLFDAETIEASERAESATGRLFHPSEQRTLLLDGVDRLSLTAQDWLLQMFGWDEAGNRLRNAQPGIATRLIASTMEDLRALASTGRFRHALYRRLATVEIAVPPLRDRMEDFPELARHFMERFARLHGRSVRRISQEAMLRLENHCWPGNLRELSDVIQDGVLRCGADSIELCHLVFARASGAERSTADVCASMRLDDVVERHVLGVLKGCGGNKLRAAEMLGISRSTLYRMLETGGSAPVLL